jgi:hypothetical protein
VEGRDGLRKVVEVLGADCEDLMWGLVIVVQNDALKGHSVSCVLVNDIVNSVKIGI